MNRQTKNNGRDVFIYFAYEPAKTARRLLRFYDSVLNSISDIDFHIVTYDRDGTPGTRIIRFEDVEFPHTVYNLASVRAMGYPAKVPRSSFPFKLHCDIPILLFWRDRPDYRRYWVIEDDVEYTGDFGALIKGLETTGTNAELLCTHLRFLPKDWNYVYLFSTGMDTLSEDRPSRVCFLPFFRATTAALAAIDGAYLRGWNGQHEMVWPAVLDAAGMPIRDIGGRGPFVAPEDRDQRYIDRSPNDYRKLGSFGTMQIRLKPGRERDVLWHPVKTLPNWITMKRKRFLSISDYYLSRCASLFSRSR
ncbi:MAG: hypothetical protein WB611_18425 [Stellaceae bacterium]